MKKVIAAILLTAASSAYADDRAPADLTVHEIPTTNMTMRPKKADKAEPKKDTAAAGTTTTATPQPTPDASTSAHFNRLPTNLADLRERVQFRINAGFQLDNAPASGDTFRGGASLPPGFSESRQWLSGDVVVGAHDIVAPSLGGYFLSSFQFDTSDTLATRTALVVPGDASDERIVIKAGYAEYQADDKNNNHLWLRGGRQFRLDGGNMFAYFDGATIGYRTPQVQISAFAGQRVSLYLDPTVSATTGLFQPPECVTNGVAQEGTTCQINPGIVFGATAQLDLKKQLGKPAKIGIDYMGLAINTADGVFDAPVNTTAESETRSLIAAYGNFDINKKTHLDIKARFLDLANAQNNGNGTLDSGGFAFGDASARLRLSPNVRTTVVIDLEQRSDKDFAYDLAAAGQADVVDVSRRLGILTAPINTTRIGAHADWRKGNKEALVFGRINLPDSSDDVHFADQQGYEEIGAGLAGAPVPQSWVTGTYTFRHYDLDSVDMLEAAGTAFDDEKSAGLRDMHELAVDGWWRNRRSANGQLRIGAGVFYRVYDLQTPYIITDTEGRGGGRADVQYWLSRELHILAAAEVAQPSPTMMREIGTLTSVRIALEARW